MNNGHPKIRVYKEKEKTQRVTHWDLDYLPMDEIVALYKQNKGNPQPKDETGPATEKSNLKLSLLLIGTGLLLLVGSLCVASLM